MQGREAAVRGLQCPVTLAARTIHQSCTSAKVRRCCAGLREHGSPRGHAHERHAVAVVVAVGAPVPAQQYLQPIPNMRMAAHAWSVCHGEERRHREVPGSCDHALLAERPAGRNKDSRGADDADEVLALELPVHILVARVPQRVDPLEPCIIRQQLCDARPAM
jgi:hypothetical protein